MSVPLYQIWSASSEELLPITRYMKIPDILDISQLRIQIVQLYSRGGNLSPQEKIIVDDPRFSHIMMADTFQEGIETILPPPTESKTENKNEGLAKHFERLADIYSQTGEKYKSKTFFEGITHIRNFQGTITSGKQLSGIPGIGPSSIKEINDYLTNPQTPRLTELLNKYPYLNEAPEGGKVKDERSATIQLFEGVFGISEERARQLYNEGYRRLDQLTNLTSAQQIGIKYYYHFKERIPRSEMIEFDKLITTVLATVAGEPITWLLIGSYRRCKESSGDLDLVCKGNLQIVVQELLSRGIITDTLAFGPKKFMGVAILPGQGHIYRRIDIRVFQEHEWAFGLLYNTGSDQFNKLMRREADIQGLHLNDFSLTHKEPPHTSYPASTEREIFGLLNMPYLLPRHRD